MNNEPPQSFMNQLADTFPENSQILAEALSKFFAILGEKDVPPSALPEKLSALAEGMFAC